MAKLTDAQRAEFNRVWPKHADGRPKKVGEMTREEKQEQFRLAAQRVQREFGHPLVQERVAAILRGENVKQ